MENEFNLSGNLKINRKKNGK
jgi:hypothetical protein